MSGGSGWHKLEGTNPAGKTPLFIALACKQSDACFLDEITHIYIDSYLSMYLIPYGHRKYIYDIYRFFEIHKQSSIYITLVHLCAHSLVGAGYERLLRL